jgi:DNA-binding XRE family transcriptional regulator
MSILKMRDDAGFPERIRALRNAVKMKQGQLSRALSVAQSLISACESGKKDASVDLCIRLATFAAQRDLLKDASWFLVRGGLDVRSVLRISEELLRELGAPITVGEIVRVPSAIPISKRRTGARAPGHLSFPSAMVPNPLSTSYVRVADDFMQPLFKRGDVLLIDSSATDLWALSGSWVAMDRHTRTLYRHDSEVRGLDPGIVQQYAQIGRDARSRLGLFAGYLRERKELGVRSLIVERPSLFGALAADVVAIEIPAGPAQKRRPPRRIELPEIAPLGRVIAWISGPEKLPDKPKRK